MPTHSWYESINPVGKDGNNWQPFCRKFSKLGQTQEELLERWRLFQFDEATDTTGSFVLMLKQYAQILGHHKGKYLNFLKTPYP